MSAEPAVHAVPARKQGTPKLREAALIFNPAAGKRSLAAAALEKLLIRSPAVAESAYVTGSRTRLADVVHFQCRKLRISSPEPLPVHVDAEVREQTPCEFECLPVCLRVVTPVTEGEGVLD